MSTLVLEISPQLRARLTARAKQEGKPIDEVARTMLENFLEAPAKPAPAPKESEEVRHQRVLENLRKEGLIREQPDRNRTPIFTEAERKEIYQEAGRADGKPLSQIVQEQRQERHDILVYGYKRARKKILARERKQVGKKSSRRKRK